MIEALLALVDELERDDSLLEAAQLRRRMDLLDRLDALLPWASGDLGDRAHQLCVRLERANQKIYQSIRHDIRRGLGGAALHKWADVVGAGPDAADQPAGDGYDHADMLLSGILQLAEPASEVAEPAAEMVFYQPTPARHIFELIRRTRLSREDVLMDLGSGLGHVPLLAAICTGARCIGVELETAYVECARRCAATLDLGNATFIQQDAREADLSSATVFYLYTPFKGGMLDGMLALLRKEADMREIRLCTLGPCTLKVAQESWLERTSPMATARPVVFRSIPG